MPRATLVTLGCKVNQYESQMMQSKLRRTGYTLVDETNPADLVIINSCTVTNFSDRKARQLVRRATRANPDAKVIVTGCYAESGKKELENIPGVAKVFGNKEKYSLLNHLEELELPTEVPNSTATSHCEEQLDSFNELEGNQPNHRTRALLKVQDGCSAFCTFCIIPYVRGRMQSRPLDEIVAETHEFANEGFAEVVLTGIHLGSYGKDIKKRASLTDIVRSIHGIDGIRRIRIGSLEPMDFSPAIVDELSEFPKLMPHFHLPIQAGSDSTLKRMHRRYTTEEYASLVSRIRTCFSHAAITTDVMVGFPGETDEDFADSLSFCETMKFTQMHVFRYSPRDGTPAAKYPNQIPGSVANSRSQAMIKMGNETAKAFRHEMIGKEMNVLVERSTDDNGLLCGYTENYIRTAVEVEPRFIGRIVPVRLTGIDGEIMTSELLGHTELGASAKLLPVIG